jgi:hypothetical protein
MRALRSLLAVVTASVMFSGSAMAAVLYDAGAVASDSFACAQSGGACGGSFYIADDFTLNSSATINVIRWTTVLTGGADTSFNGARAWILSAPGPLSSSILHTISLQAVTPTANASLADAYDIALVDVIGINLSAGTYWLAVQSDVSSGFATGAMTANLLGAQSEQWSTSGTFANFVYNTDWAFCLSSGYDCSPSGAVPIPSTLALLLLGGLAVPIVGRRFAH